MTSIDLYCQQYRAFADLCLLCCVAVPNREDAFQEYVELETVYLDCLEAAAQGSVHSGGVGSHTDFGRHTGLHTHCNSARAQMIEPYLALSAYNIISSCFHVSSYDLASYTLRMHGSFVCSNTRLVRVLTSAMPAAVPCCAVHPQV
jgi:hypothetical protein